MIVIEPPQPRGTPRRDTVRKRELRGFLMRAIQSVGLRGTVSVLLTGDAQIRQLNRDYRGKDQATDVLSFPAADLDATGGRSSRLAGDLAVSLETAARQAQAFGHPLETEVKVLLLHGLLHLAGFDHETDSGQMARRESRLRKELALPSGLIQRSKGKVGADFIPPIAGGSRTKRLQTLKSAAEAPTTLSSRANPDPERSEGEGAVEGPAVPSSAMPAHSRSAKRNPGLKGHGFSRAANSSKRNATLVAEGRSSPPRRRPAR